MKNDKEIGERLRAYRAKLKLTQEDFAHKFNTTQKAISKMETGKLGISDDLKIALLNNGVNINWLLTNTGSMLLDNSKLLTTLNKIEDKSKKTIDELRSENMRLSKDLIKALKKLAKLED